MNRPRRLQNTSAYLVLREQSQALFDFAVLACHAVPALKRDLASVAGTKGAALAPPDYFQPGTTTLAQLSSSAAVYEQRLSMYVLLSTFSFFEAYVKDALLEMLAFHGGQESFAQQAAKRQASFMASLPPGVNPKVQKLRKPVPTDTLRRYSQRKIIEELRRSGYRFPSEFLAPFGVRMLARQLTNFKASSIPMLLTEGLHVPLSTADRDAFEEIRIARNKAAHGKPTALKLFEVSAMSDTLRGLAKRTEDHLIQYYFVREALT